MRSTSVSKRKTVNAEGPHRRSAESTVRVAKHQALTPESDSASRVVDAQPADRDDRPMPAPSDDHLDDDGGGARLPIGDAVTLDG
jgi:hypothetical protein